MAHIKGHLVTVRVLVYTARVTRPGCHPVHHSSIMCPLNCSHGPHLKLLLLALRLQQGGCGLKLCGPLFCGCPLYRAYSKPRCSRSAAAAGPGEADGSTGWQAATAFMARGAAQAGNLKVLKQAELMMCSCAYACTCVVMACMLAVSPGGCLPAMHHAACTAAAARSRAGCWMRQGQHGM